MKALVLMALIPAITLANEPKQFRDSYEGFKYTQERTDKFVIACLQSMTGAITNFGQAYGRHQELEDLAIQCADRLIKKLDDYDYGKQEAK